MGDGIYNFEQLTREIVSSQLKDSPGASAQAAAIVKKTVVAGIKGTMNVKAAQNPRDTVQQICKGAMGGLLLIEQRLPEAAVQILRNISEVAQEVHLESSQLMTWAMEGIAQITPMTDPDLRSDIREAIDQAFMGAGQIFNELCEKASKRAYMEFQD